MDTNLVVRHQPEVFLHMYELFGGVGLLLLLKFNRSAPLTKSRKKSILRHLNLVLNKSDV